MDAARPQRETARVSPSITAAGPEPEQGAARPVRLCFAAPHVVLLPGYRGLHRSADRPGTASENAALIDWPSTLRVRQHLDAHGFGIAEAMDTAQRSQLGWDAASQLIAACGRLRPRHGFVAGAGSDHLAAVRNRTGLIDAVVAQARFVQRHGGIAMLLPQPWLVAQGCSEQDYVDVYTAIVDQLEGPLFVHWLGAMFAPTLQGYFPGDSFRRVLAHDPGKVRGCKLSLLDPAREVELRRELLPRGQIVLTGDDLHFGRLLLGGAAPGPEPTPPPAEPPPVERWTTIGGTPVALGDFSHALLGVLTGIAAPAAAALRALAAGDAAGFLARMLPCEALGRHLFAPPTRHYKAGLAFLCWLRGLQDNPMLLERQDRARDRAHYLRCAELAFACGALDRDELALQRLAVAEDGRLEAVP